MDVTKLFDDAEEKVKPQLVQQAWESARRSFHDLFSNMKERGLPEDLMVPIASDGYFSQTGIRMDTVIRTFFEEWKVKNF